MRAVVYVSGPYSADPVGGTRAALDAADELIGAGFAPVVPHLSLFADLVHPRPWEDWVAVDLAVVARCDAVLRLPGVSPGADMEVDEARRHDLFVATTVDQIAEWFGRS